MHHAPLPPPLPAEKPSLVARVASARFFTFSFLIHLVLLVFAGGIVLVHQSEPKLDFPGGENVEFLTESDATKPHVDPQPVDLTQFTPSTSAPTAELNVLSTTGLY